MKTGYQIYCRRNGESTFHECGLNNWFWKEEEAIARCETLNRDWQGISEYIIIHIG